MCPADGDTQWVLTPAAQGGVTQATAKLDQLTALRAELEARLLQQEGCPLATLLPLASILGEASLLGDLAEEAEPWWQDHTLAMLEVLVETLALFTPEGCLFGQEPGGGAPSLGYWPIPEGAMSDGEQT